MFWEKVKEDGVYSQMSGLNLRDNFLYHSLIANISRCSVICTCLINRDLRGFYKKNAPTAAPKPAKAGAIVFNGAAAAMDCPAGPEPLEPDCDGPALLVVADPAAAPVADALPALGVAAADAPNFSVPAVMTSG